jgi:dTDP-4-amino-4,6-dideoxygalactose transaminase
MTVQRPNSRSPTIPVAEPDLGPDEKSALLDVIDSGWITMGENVSSFEQEFARAHGAPDAVAVASCTGGLHLVMQAFGLGPGDEVLVPALSFVATANCVLYVGATPVFVDIESLERPLMSLADAEWKCTERTRAVILVHYAGYVCDRERWRAFAAARSLILIEDAAHCAGLPEAGRLGDAAVFSFYGNKNMTTAEGGMVVAPDRALRERLRSMRGHGLTSGTFERHSAGLPGYDVTMLGFNYRMDELRAAIGLVQLKRLFAWNERRELLSRAYRTPLGESAPEIVVPFPDGGPSSHHIMPVLLPRGVSRPLVIETLRAAGIQTTIHYPAIHQLSFYARQFPDVRLDVTEEYCGRELTLPLYPRLEDAEVGLITSTLAEAIRG